MKRPMIINADGSEERGHAVQVDPGFCLKLPPEDLTFIRIDWQVHLQFGSAEVVIGCPFVVSTASQQHQLDPEVRAHLGPLLDLFPDALSTAAVAIDGTLGLSFVSGTSITVPPDADYEAWQVSGPAGYLVVCLPGSGQLAVWSSEA